MERKNNVYFYMITPLIVYLIISVAIPAIYFFSLTFKDWNLTRPGSNVFIGISNYIKMFKDKEFWSSFRVTMFFIAVPTVIQMVLGLALALLLNREWKLVKVARAFYIIPMVLPPIIVGLTWKILFIPQLGGLNFYLNQIGISAPDWLNSPIYARWAIVIAAVWEWTPFVFLMLLAGLENIPQTPFEVALVDGANKLQRFFHITIPLLKPYLIVVLLFRIIESVKVFPLIFAMTQGGPGASTENMDFYAYVRSFKYFEISYGATLLVVVFLIVFLFSVLFINSRIKEEMRY